MWKHHWKLSRDPFLDADSPYVSTPMHDEAVARLVEIAAANQRSATVRAGEGLGKSRVLDQFLREIRDPSRRVARIASPADGKALLSGLAERFGASVSPGASRALAWRALCDAVSVCRWQKLQVILAVDDCQNLVDPADRRDLERLTHIDAHPDARVTVIRVYRHDDQVPPDDEPWSLKIRLDALTRAETERYLDAKLAAAGRSEPTFTPRSIHRLHTTSAGVPRGIDRLASLALMAGAWRGLEIVTPEVVDGVAAECVGPVAPF